jgi:hypothetical protein
MWISSRRHIIDCQPMGSRDFKPSSYKRRSWISATLALILFCIAFGYVEAAVVVYLRNLSEPVRVSYYPNTTSADLFPILTPEELRAADHGRLWQLLHVEIPREAATLVMLAAVAFIVGTNSMERLAAFVIAFGTWDVAFYGFLKVLIGWPASLLTWDLLLLLPVPWSGPVLAPVLVSLAMIGGGMIVLRREAAGRAVRLGALDWTGVFLGAFIILGSFTWDYRNVLAGRMPHSYEWPLFVLGEGISVASFLRGLTRRESE